MDRLHLVPMSLTRSGKKHARRHTSLLEFQGKTWLTMEMLSSLGLGALMRFFSLKPVQENPKASSVQRINRS